MSQAIDNYNANAIETLSFRDAIRSRVAMYMGSADNQGVLQCIREIITNSIDEATMGYGDEIQVILYPNNTIEIKDKGRGCPFGKRVDNTEALEAIYTMPHSGGKFNDKLYQNVGGQNGIGAKGTALSSSLFEVWSRRGGKVAYLRLKDGIKESFSISETTLRDTGTTVKFKPSQEVYNLEKIHIDFNDVKKMCRDWSYLYPQVTFRLKDENTGEALTYRSKNGLLDFMKDTGAAPIHKTPLHIVYRDGDFEAEIVMEWTTDRREHSYTFTNGLENPEGGTSLTGIKTALTNYFKKKVKGECSPDVLRKGLLYAVSCKVPHPSFANQTKTKINNPELRGLCQKATNQMLEEFENHNGNEFNKILELLLKEVKAEAAAERARRQVLEATKDIEKNQRKKVIASSKLKDAEVLGEGSTLLIVEGQSALGGMARSRDYVHYGLLGIRGKMINCLNHDDEKIYQNEEIKLLLSAMNIIPGKYDGKRLRYGKIGVCVDADADGYHIGLLIMSALQHIAPEFIKEGRLYWLRAPLYIVTNKSGNNYYFNDKEFQEAKAKNKIAGEITRAKGLGEMSDDVAHESMFDKKYQRLEPITYSQEGVNLLYDLMGVSVAPRTDFVFKNIDFSQLRE